MLQKLFVNISINSKQNPVLVQKANNVNNEILPHKEIENNTSNSIIPNSSGVYSDSSKTGNLFNEQSLSQSQGLDNHLKVFCVSFRF